MHVEVRAQCMGVSALLYHVGPRHQTQVARLGSKHLCLLSHLTGPWPSIICAAEEDLEFQDFLSLLPKCWGVMGMCYQVSFM